MADFGWTIDMEIIEKLREEPLFIQRLLPDILEGEVIPSIGHRGVVYFYYWGRFLFSYDGAFKTSLRTVVLSQAEDEHEHVDETALAGMKLRANFLDDYEEIKAYCARKSWRRRTDIDFFWPWISFAAKARSRYSLLDLDVELDSEMWEEPWWDIYADDMVLMDAKKERLLFCMWKHYGDMEGSPDYEAGNIAGQLAYRRDLIAGQRDAILDWYGEYTRAMEALLGIAVPAPICVCDDCGLVIHGFDEDQRNGKLKKILDSLTEMGWPVYAEEENHEFILTPEKLFKALARGGRVIEANRIVRLT